jgi:predicted nucleic acid-binding protein
MMIGVKRTVYIETTIPSYYHDVRPDLVPEIARVREWWDEERHNYEVFTSQVVLDELSSGQYPSKNACLQLLAEVPLLDVTEESERVAGIYQAQRVMPAPPVRDALHVALATCYKLDFLLTWNCRHLANANKFAHLRAVNATLGYATPELVTPYQLRPVEEQ